MLSAKLSWHIESMSSMAKLYHAVLPLAFLFVARSSNVIIGFFLLPYYNRLLGAELFGIIAVILSLQTLLVMMDLGMSIILSREVAAEPSSRAHDLFRLIRDAENSIVFFYALLMASAALTVFSGILPSVVTGEMILALLGFFMVMVLQNIHFCVIIARKNFITGSAVQFIGVLSKAAATVALLRMWPSLECFVFSQLVMSFAHLCMTRKVSMSFYEKGATVASHFCSTQFSRMLHVMKQGAPLIVFGIAGAAVTQLDKPIISWFMGASDVAPYYLAALLCMAPISILAGPVNQFFQPMLIESLSRQLPDRSTQLIRYYVTAVFFIVGLPSFLLWTFREQFISIWLGSGAINDLVASYVKVLLPGVAIGALGYVPYSLLVYAKDFRFQGMLSALLTFLTLLIVGWAAYRGNIRMICISYVAYYLFSVFSCQLRTIALPATRACALESSKVGGTLALLAVLIGYFVEIARSMWES